MSGELSWGQWISPSVVGGGPRSQCLNRHQLDIIEVRVTVESRMSFNSLEAEQLSETAGGVYYRVAHGVVQVTTNFCGGTTWIR